MPQIFNSQSQRQADSSTGDVSFAQMLELLDAVSGATSSPDSPEIFPITPAAPDAGGIISASEPEVVQDVAAPNLSLEPSHSSGPVDDIIKSISEAYVESVTDQSDRNLENLGRIRSEIGPETLSEFAVRNVGRTASGITYKLLAESGLISQEEAQRKLVEIGQRRQAELGAAQFMGAGRGFQLGSGALESLIYSLGGGIVGSSLGRLISPLASTASGASRISSVVTVSGSLISNFAASFTNTMSEDLVKGIKFENAEKHAAMTAGSEFLIETLFSAMGMGGLERVISDSAVRGALRDRISQYATSALEEAPSLFTSIRRAAAKSIKDYTKTLQEELLSEYLTELANVGGDRLFGVDSPAELALTFEDGNIYRTDEKGNIVFSPGLERIIGIAVQTGLAVGGTKAIVTSKEAIDFSRNPSRRNFERLSPELKEILSRYVSSSPESETGTPSESRPSSTNNEKARQKMASALEETRTFIVRKETQARRLINELFEKANIDIGRVVAYAQSNAEKSISKTAINISGLQEFMEEIGRLREQAGGDVSSITPAQVSAALEKSRASIPLERAMELMRADQSAIDALSDILNRQTRESRLETAPFEVPEEFKQQARRVVEDYQATVPENLRVPERIALPPGQLLDAYSLREVRESQSENDKVPLDTTSNAAATVEIAEGDTLLIPRTTQSGKEVAELFHVRNIDVSTGEAIVEKLQSQSDSSGNRKSNTNANVSTVNVNQLPDSALLIPTRGIQNSRTKGHVISRAISKRKDIDRILKIEEKTNERLFALGFSPEEIGNFDSPLKDALLEITDRAERSLLTELVALQIRSQSFQGKDANLSPLQRESKIRRDAVQLVKSFRSGDPFGVLDAIFGEPGRTSKLSRRRIFQKRKKSAQSILSGNPADAIAGRFSPHPPPDSVATESLPPNFETQGLASFEKSMLPDLVPAKSKVGKFLQKYFRTTGDLDPSVYVATERNKRRLRSSKEHIEQIISEISNTLVTSGYSPTGTLSQQDALAINMFMNSLDSMRNVYYSLVPEPIRQNVLELRAGIDFYSRELIRQGVVQGRLIPVIMSNLTTYLNRSYRAFTDKNWVTEMRMGERNLNRMISMLRSELTGEDISPAEMDIYIERMLSITDDQQLSELATDIGISEDSVRKIYEVVAGDHVSKKLFGVIPKKKAVDRETRILEARNVLREMLQEENKKRLEEYEKEVLKAKKRNALSQAEGQPASPLPDKEEFGVLSEEQIEGQLETRIREIIALGENYSSIYQLMNYDSLKPRPVQILQKKSDVPKYYRRLLGEVTNPIDRAGRSMFYVSGLLSTHKMLSELRDNATRTLFYPPTDTVRPAGFEYQIPPRLSVNNPLYPLAGWYTTKEMAEAFQITAGQIARRSWMPVKIYASVVGGIRAGKTILSWSTQFINFITNTNFSVIDGAFFSEESWEIGARGMLQALYPELSMTGITGLTAKAIRRLSSRAKGTSTSRRQYVSDAILHGVLEGAEIHLSEVQRLIGGDMDTLAQLADMINDNEGHGIFSSIMSNWKSFYSKAQAFYGAGDGFWKLLSWEFHKSRLREINEKHGLGKSESQIKQEAAEIVRNRYPTTSKIPEITRIVSRAPVISTFPSFHSELIRTSWKTLETAWKTLRDPSALPEEKQYQAGTLARFMLVTSVTPLFVSLMTRMLSGMDRDDEEAARESLPDYARDDTYAWLGRDSRGFLRAFSLTRMTPHLIFADSIRRAVFARDNESVAEAAVDAMASFLQPFMQEDILFQRMREAMNGRTKNGRLLWDESNTGLEVFTKVSQHMLAGVSPTPVGQAIRITKAATGTIEKNRTFILSEEIVSALTGARSFAVDPERTAYHQIGNAARVIQLAEGNFRNKITTQAKVSDEDIAEAYLSFERTRKNMFQEMYFAVRRALITGASLKDVLKIMDRRGLSVEQSHQIINGIYEPYVPTSRFLSDVELPHTKTIGADRKEFIRRRRFLTHYARQHKMQMDESNRRLGEKLLRINSDDRQPKTGIPRDNRHIPQLRKAFRKLGVPSS